MNIKSKKTNKIELITLNDVKEFLKEQFGVSFNGYTYFKECGRTKSYFVKSFNEIKEASGNFFFFDSSNSTKDWENVRMTINEFEFKKFKQNLKLVKDYSDEWIKFCLNKYKKIYLEYGFKIIEYKEKELFEYSKAQMEELNASIKVVEEKRDKDLIWAEKHKKKLIGKNKNLDEINMYLEDIVSNSEICIQYIQNLIVEKELKLKEKLKKLEELKNKFSILKYDLNNNVF